MHMGFSKELFCMEINRKIAADTSGDIVLCEPARSKCTWTCHKRHFGRKFTGKMPDASDTTSVEHRALTVTVRTPQCGHTVGEKTDFVRSARSCAQVAGVSVTVVTMFLFDVSCVCRLEHVGTRDHEHVAVGCCPFCLSHFPTTLPPRVPLGGTFMTLKLCHVA